MKNPFETGRVYGGHVIQHLGAVDRIERVKRFDADQCRAALTLPDLQKTVLAAIERRLRALEKAARWSRRLTQPEGA